MAKYQYTDTLGNVHILLVREDNRVVMWDQHRNPLCLSNVGFMLPGGYENRKRAVKAAAQVGLKELIRVTKLPWIQLS